MINNRTDMKSRLQFVFNNKRHKYYKFMHLSTYLTWKLANEHIIVKLTSRFQVALCLFSNKSQMMSKCGKDKKVARKAIAEGH